MNALPPPDYTSLPQSCIPLTVTEYQEIYNGRSNITLPSLQFVSYILNLAFSHDETIQRYLMHKSFVLEDNDELMEYYKLYEDPFSELYSIFFINECFGDQLKDKNIMELLTIGFFRIFPKDAFDVFKDSILRPTNEKEFLYLFNNIFSQLADCPRKFESISQSLPIFAFFFRYYLPRSGENLEQLRNPSGIDAILSNRAETLETSELLLQPAYHWLQMAKKQKDEEAIEEIENFQSFSF